MRHLYDNQDMKCFWIREAEGDTFGVAIVVVVALVVVAVAGLEIASYCLLKWEEYTNVCKFILFCGIFMCCG